MQSTRHNPYVHSIEQIDDILAQKNYVLARYMLQNYPDGIGKDVRLMACAFKQRDCRLLLGIIDLVKRVDLRPSFSWVSEWASYFEAIAPLCIDAAIMPGVLEAVFSMSHNRVVQHFIAYTGIIYGAPETQEYFRFRQSILYLTVAPIIPFNFWEPLIEGRHPAQEMPEVREAVAVVEDAPEDISVVAVEQPAAAQEVLVIVPPYVTSFRKGAVPFSPGKIPGGQAREISDLIVAKKYQEARDLIVRALSKNPHCFPLKVRFLACAFKLEQQDDLRFCIRDIINTIECADEKQAKSWHWALEWAQYFEAIEPQLAGQPVDTKKLTALEKAKDSVVAHFSYMTLVKTGKRSLLKRFNCECKPILPTNFLEDLI